MPKRLAILGGTFDPPHFGHLALAEDVRFDLGAERMLLIPAAQQPFKTREELAPAADRLAMTRLAVADDPLFAVSDVEIRRGGVSYTVDTLEQLHAELPDTELFFAVGADAALELQFWRRPERIFELATIVVAGRPGYVVDLAAHERELPGARGRLLWLDGPNFDISSTELRLRLGQGRPARFWLPRPVYEYIQEHRLYRDAATDAAV